MCFDFGISLAEIVVHPALREAFREALVMFQTMAHVAADGGIQKDRRSLHIGAVFETREQLGHLIEEVEIGLEQFGHGEGIRLEMGRCGGHRPRTSRGGGAG